MLGKCPTVTNVEYSKSWNKLFLRQKTHFSHKALLQLKPAVQKIHAKLLWKEKCGTFALCNIVNMYQAPLFFVFDDVRTYDAKGFEEI